MKKVFLILVFCFMNLVYAKSISNIDLPLFGSNKVFKLSSYKNKKIVINFWASWCTACAQEISELESLKKKYPGAIFIAINAGEKQKNIKRFLNKYKFTYLILEDKNRVFSKNIGINSLPQTIVLGENHEIEYHSHIPPKKL